MKKHILVVEDDKTLLEAISFRLKTEGYEVETAESGWEALEIITGKKIDLIISDIMMPNISGLSLLSMINRFYHERIPVIMISSLDRANVIVSAMGLGANDFMTKPLDFKKLIDKIKKIFFSGKR